ncbi:MAG: bifunctional UDP-N-acetylglucosamine diphosphorylase/glucosamine-1-phosphate N-acetyltransferase GlmU [Clostridiales bacterium]|jgi:bifunctional UDP-N-acetylglucosamine pyrophosphorylase/glucosamine-1-phosphate N-acetyltransferase|nr:bifunctional UDP-N-acetylglucosamine diphosphorylase/glucosamine-1-phosphate N-acetyltransferase GlmU [Clostridiales bacterium]
MKAIILAAGKGKRMQSDLQKVMHPVLGKPIVQYVVEAARDAGFDDVTVVVGKDGEEIKVGLKNCGGLFFAVQDEPLGTGHAVQAGSERIKDDDDVLVLCGDMPLVTGEFIKEFMASRSKEKAEAVVCAVYRENVGDFGSVYDTDGEFVEIVEAKDITEKHATTTWANTGIYLFKGASLLRGLKKLKNENSQGEYYLTDVPKILKDEGASVRVFHSYADMSVFTGINTQIHLAEAVGHMRARINARHMMNGVRMVDPASVFIDDSVKISRGAVIYPGVILEGFCEIKENAVIVNSHLKDTIVRANASVRNSIADGAVVGAGTNVGPFAYLRPGALIGERCRIGNFVEVKNATIGDGTAMAHLAYIGDADVGCGVNFSCGAITANYDGKEKHRTTIGDGAFIGSNSNLVAPVNIGENAVVAAGSTITDDVPSCALGIARERQIVKLNRYKN